MEPEGQPGKPAPPEAVQAGKVVETVSHASLAEKRSLAIDHRLVMSEVQLLLAEKRTAFALLRTGVTVALVPLSMWTVLVATRSLWNPFDVLWLLVPMMALAAALFLLGSYLVLHALERVRHVDRVMLGLRRKDTLLEDLLYKERDPLRDLGRAARLDRIPRLRRRTV
jgi:hypothetical protein